MRIVMLSRLYSPHIGGVEKHVKEISKIAVQKGHSVDIFTLKHNHTLPTIQKDEGITIHRLPTALHSRILKPLVFSLPFIPKKAAQAIVERDELWGWMLWNLPKFFCADIIHIHDVFFWYWPLRILLFWKKVFITFHGFEAGSLPTAKAKKARLRAANLTHGNIAVGKWIQKWYGTKADFVTYGAASCNVSKRTNQKGKQAVFIGRLEEDTGILAYIEAATKSKTYLDIYGDGPLKERVSTQQNEYVQYLGLTQNACYVFPEYKVACVSSYLSIIEALQCNIPVIAYTHNSLKSDYLDALPISTEIAIAKDKKGIGEVLQGIHTREVQEKTKRASDWAMKQTWENLYNLYDSLWMR